MFRHPADSRLLLAYAALAVGCSTNPATHDAAMNDVAIDAMDVIDATADTNAPLVPGVGMRTYPWSDPSRMTPANGDAGAMPSRQLPTDLYYPALTADGSLEADAALDPSHAPYPLVLFVHGSSSTRAQSRSILKALAADGYVVGAADFPLTALSTPGGPSDLHVADQVGDLSFLATQVAQLATTPGDPMAGAVDPNAGYSVMGHSTGGTVTLLALQAPDLHDPRVRAGIALAPCACFFGDSFFQTRMLPLLVMAGTDDLFVPIATNGARAYMLTPPPHAFATLVGGSHLFFTDANIPDSVFMPMPTTADDAIALALSQYGGGTVCSPPPPPGSDPLMTLAEQHAHTIAWVTAFFDATLRSQPAALDALEAAQDPAVIVSHDGI